MIKYNSVVLFCKDIERSKIFYQDMFMLDIELVIGGLVTYSCGISLWEQKDAKEQLYPGTDQISSPEYPIQELYFETDEIVEFSTLLIEKKIRILHPVTTTPWNQRTIRFFDPDGNLIEVGESMDHIVRRLSKEGLSFEEISQKTWFPIEIIKKMLGSV